MMTQTLPLFGYRLVNSDQGTAVAALLDRPGRTTAAFMNAHCANVAARDELYKRALKAADFILPDGSGISLAAKLVGRRFKANLNGTDLCAPLCEAAAHRGLPIFLLGGKPGIAERAADNLRAKMPSLQIAGTHDGYFDETRSEEVVEAINASGAAIVLVAMGVPRQETWIYRHRPALKPQLVMGVGALLDFEAGAVSRAPKALRARGLEWTWRLAIEPRRMAARYLLGNPEFVGRAVAHALATRASRLARPTPRTGASVGNSVAMPRSKRLLDIAIASSALLMLSPVFAAAALAVKLSSRGPVLFHQNRVGLDGKHFGMIKFRSMHVDAEARKTALLAQSERDGVCFKMKNDPRLTPVGGFIRRFSIDELPQLWNVLRGDMSIVGPRPALPEEVAAYPGSALRRLQAVPGITGIWQVSGRAEIGFQRMVAMDVSYIRTKSLLLDLLIIGRTAQAVFGGKGAY